MHYDVIVVGLGAMGSAAVYQASKRGTAVLGIDRYHPPHTHGSTHGDTRITRVAIGEGKEYVPLVMRSHEIWKELEAASGESLLVECGGVIIDVPGGHGQHGVASFTDATTQAAIAYGIEHQTLNTDQLQQTYPYFHFDNNEQGYTEPTAGYLHVEQCVQTQLEQAADHGATLRYGETVLSFNDGDVVTINTDKGEYTADKIILSVGSWMNTLLPQYAHLFRTYRQVLYWFDFDGDDWYEQYADTPVYIWEFGPREGDSMYGFPAIDGPEGGLKVAMEDYETEVGPDKVNRTVSAEETQAMFDHYVSGKLLGINGRCIKSATCLYTSTPDHRFVIDIHPDHHNVIVASPCSGHGFKHSAAIGESVAQWALNGKSDIDLSAFSFNRFT